MGSTVNMHPIPNPANILAKYRKHTLLEKANIDQDTRKAIMSASKVHFRPILSTTKPARNGPKHAPTATKELIHAACSSVTWIFSPGLVILDNVGEVHVSMQPVATAAKLAGKRQF